MQKEQKKIQMSGSLLKGVCLVAGAGPGIGLSVAKKFARYE